MKLAHRDSWGSAFEIQRKLGLRKVADIFLGDVPGLLNQFESALASVFFCILCTMDLQRYSISQYIYILVLDSLIHTYVYTYLYIYVRLWLQYFIFC